jgi:hypothetical protein
MIRELIWTLSQLVDIFQMIMYIYFVYFTIVRFGVLKKGSNKRSVLFSHGPNEAGVWFVYVEESILTVCK